MNEESRGALEEALREVEALGKDGGRADRHHARGLLVPLGELLDADADVATELERARSAVERLGASWPAALADELSLACAEHVHSVDPRYLSLPNYDWEYTLEARRRLEARIVACRALGFAFPDTLLESVHRADRTLAEHRGRP